MQGTTLREWLDAKPRTPDEVLQMFMAAGAGLQAAHHAGLVHRDFKPENFLVGSDLRPRVVDFGLARAETDATTTTAGHGQELPDAPLLRSLTIAGSLAGTPGVFGHQRKPIGVSRARSSS